MASNNLYPHFGILLIDDEASYLRSFSLALEHRLSYTHIHRCTDSRKALDMLNEFDIGVVLLDLTMPFLSGKELLPLIIEEHPNISVIIISGLNQIETAMDCIKLGAIDYFVKTTEQNRLFDGIRKAVETQELQIENQTLKQSLLTNSLEQPDAFDSIITQDKNMHAIFQYIESIANSKQPVLICGESGVGKELIANAIHKLNNSSGPIVSVNVAGLDDNMFADTLFGHSRGAFTGANTTRAGIIEAAAGGVLLLDEIGDLSIASQVKLLRLLQEGEYYPLGSDTPKRLRARVIVATHQDLNQKQLDGTFRKDLYYRLRTHQITVPPLRKRIHDIPLLLEHFITLAANEQQKKTPSIPKELIVLLANYHFPGNIRELRSLVYDAISQHQSKILSMSTFKKIIDPESTTQLHSVAIPTSYFDAEQPLPSLAMMNEYLIQEAMQRSNGNQSLASRMLGISQPALSKRLSKANTPTQSL